MAVTMALAPVISRLYSPTEFGVFAAILAVASTMIGAGSLRLEVLAQARSDLEDQVAMVKLSIIAVSITAAVVSAVLGALVVARTVDAIWVLVGPMIWIGSAPAIGTATLVLERRYRSLAAQNFVLHSGTSASQSLAGLALGGPGGLFVGFFLGRITWLPRIMVWLRRKNASLKQVWMDHRGDAMAAGGSALVNSTAGQLLPILLIVAYGSGPAGLVAMALRVAISPMNVVGQAVSSAAAGEIGKAIRAGDLTAARTKLARGMRDQSAFAAPISLVLGGAAPFFSGSILGDEWSEAGLAITFLVIGGYAQFVVAPFSQVLNFAGQTKSLFRWDLMRIAVFALTLTVPAAVGMSWLVTVAIYSLSQVPLYVDLARRVRKAVSPPEPRSALADVVSMIGAGRHAERSVGSEDEGSWKS